MAKQEVNRYTQSRIDAAPNPKVAKIMAMTDADKRGVALFNAGYCSYANGSCRADHGKVAKLALNERTKEPAAECAFHLNYARKQAKKEGKTAQASGPKVVRTTQAVAPHLLNSVDIDTLARSVASAVMNGATMTPVAKTRDEMFADIGKGLALGVKQIGFRK